MKILFIFSLLLALSHASFGQNLRDDGIDSSKRGVYIFKTRSCGIVVSPDLIITSRDYTSFWLVSKQDLITNYNGTHAVAGVYIDVKNGVKILTLKELLAHFNLSLDISKYRIQINNELPIKKRNLFGSLQSIETITEDKQLRIVHIVSVKL